MGKGGRKNKKKKLVPKKAGHRPRKGRVVPSLYDEIVDGREYGSIVGAVLPDDTDLLGEVVRGIVEIEKVRARPCLLYVGNVVRPDDGSSAIDPTDDLPFQEMVNAVPADIKAIDLFLATRGGSAHQINRFVTCLRERFDDVDFLIPSFCMSAGTLFALSGDKIWMTEGACLGPIDPQVPTKEGRFVPAQALLLLIDRLQQQGDAAMEKAGRVPWSAVRIVDSIDKKELGEAITASNYSTHMASQFITNYKFRHWEKHSSTGEPVTPEEKVKRAEEIAQALVAHDRWMNHGHAITRDVLWQEIKLLIHHPDDDLRRAMIRLWALLYWVFDKTPILKLIISNYYRFVRSEIRMEAAR